MAMSREEKLNNERIGWPPGRENESDLQRLRGDWPRGQMVNGG
jgi:hypothetical protein